MKLLLSKIIAGFVIGAGAIIPGLSGGILAVSLGLYKPTIEAITGFFKAPKKNFKFLFPLGVGGVIGLVLFMFLIDRTFARYKTAVIALFLGLVAGSVPAFFSEANNGEPFKKSNAIFALLGFAFAFSLVLLGLMTGDTQSGSKELTWYTSMLAGGIVMMGVVLPGVSTSFILINMNIYDNFLAVFAHFTDDPGRNIVLALFALLGIIIVAVPMLLLVRKVIMKYHSQSFYFLFGILIATLAGCVISEVIRLKNNPADFSVLLIVIAAALFIVGIFVSYVMERAMEKLKQAEAEKEQALS